LSSPNKLEYGRAHGGGEERRFLRRSQNRAAIPDLRSGNHHRHFRRAYQPLVVSGQYIIPSSRLNPTARNIANFYDLPNTAGAADDTGNYFTTGPEWDHYYNHIFRVDHNFSEKNRMFVRGDVTGRDQNFGYLFNGANGDNLLQHNRGAAIDDVYTITPQFLLNVRYSYTRFLYFQHPLQLGMDLPSLGFSPQFVAQAKSEGPLGYRLPVINISGYSPLSVAQGSAVNPNEQHYDTHDLGVNFTRVVRAHNMRFGLGYRVNRQDNYNLGSASGTFSFDTTYTRGPNDTSAGAPWGKAWPPSFSGCLALVSNQRLHGRTIDRFGPLFSG
jgi:hypothetical protein